VTGARRTPACPGCGGSGYVYLWSIARVGTRVWYCNRFTCKQFWSNARPSVPMVGNDALVMHELEPVVSGTDLRVLQPV
jgi:hypothetical protein